MRRPDRGPTPLDGVDVLLADLDGVVYTGPDALPYAVESINRAQQSIRVGYLTNNASRTDAAVASHLTDLGLTVAPEDVVTSPQAAIPEGEDTVEIIEELGNEPHSDDGDAAAPSEVDDEGTDVSPA